MTPRMNRRDTFLAGGAAVLTGMLARPAAAEGPAAEPVRFDKPQGLTSVGLTADALKFTSNISPDGRAVTLLFGGAFQFSLGQPDTDLTKTWAASLQIPQTFQQNPPPPLIVYSNVVRGSVDKAAGTRIVLTLDLGSTSHVVEYPFGKATHDDWDATVLSPVPSVEKPSKTDQGTPVVTTVPLFLSYYPVTISVTIQRATPQDSALISLGSIDIETPSAVQASPPARKPKS
jgi:hypothetical protein